MGNLNACFVGKYTKKDGHSFIMEAFHKRLCVIMKERGITQCELCERTGIPKSALSQYISGRFKPKQNRTLLLANVLSVDPAWLLGYDVPRDGFRRDNDELEVNEPDPNLAPQNERERLLIATYRKNSHIRSEIDRLLDSDDANKTTRIFRAAKSESGQYSAGDDEIPTSQLKLLKSAPETDDDL